MPDIFSRLAERIQAVEPVLRPPELPWSEGPSDLVTQFAETPPLQGTVQGVKQLITHDGAAPEPHPAASARTETGRTGRAHHMVNATASERHAVVAGEARPRPHAEEQPHPDKDQDAAPPPPRFARTEAAAVPPARPAEQANTVSPQAPTLATVISLLDAGAPAGRNTKDDTYGAGAGAAAQQVTEGGPEAPAAITIAIGDVIVRPRARERAVHSTPAPTGSVSLADYLSVRR